MGGEKEGKKSKEKKTPTAFCAYDNIIKYITFLFLFFCPCTRPAASDMPIPLMPTHDHGASRQRRTSAPDYPTITRLYVRIHVAFRYGPCRCFREIIIPLHCLHVKPMCSPDLRRVPRPRRV